MKTMLCRKLELHVSFGAKRPQSKKCFFFFHYLVDKYSVFVLEERNSSWREQVLDSPSPSSGLYPKKIFRSDRTSDTVETPNPTHPGGETQPLTDTLHPIHCWVDELKGDCFSVCTPTGNPALDLLV